MDGRCQMPDVSHAGRSARHGERATGGRKFQTAVWRVWFDGTTDNYRCSRVAERRVAGCWRAVLGMTPGITKDLKCRLNNGCCMACMQHWAARERGLQDALNAGASENLEVESQGVTSGVTRSTHCGRDGDSASASASGRDCTLNCYRTTAGGVFTVHCALTASPSRVASCFYHCPPTGPRYGLRRCTTVLEHVILCWFLGRLASLRPLLLAAIPIDYALLPTVHLPKARASWLGPCSPMANPTSAEEIRPPQSHKPADAFRFLASFAATACKILGPAVTASASHNLDAANQHPALRCGIANKEPARAWEKPLAIAADRILLPDAYFSFLPTAELATKGGEGSLSWKGC